MQAIAERAKQAFGVGRDTGFVPSSLEPQQKTIEELSVFADPLRRMLTNAEHFQKDTAEFLRTTCSFICDTPFPRLWTQVSPLEPAQALHTPVQAEHAAWFDAETHASLKLNVADAVKYSLQRELLSPMKQWLLAYDVLKANLARLESRRLAYDADRRKLAAAAAKSQDAATAEAVVVAVGDDSSVGSSTAAAAAAVEVAQLQENAASASPVLSEFESDVEALDDGLSWLVSGALRLKALIADTAGGVAVAASNWQIPPGLMPAQEPSTFGEGYEVTMTVTDAPGVEKLLGHEAPPQATTATPELTDAAQRSSTRDDDDVGSKAEVGSMTHSAADDHHLVSDEESFDTAASGSSDDSDDHFVDDEPASAAEGGGSILGRIKQKVTQMVGHKGQGNRDTAAAAAEGGDEAVDPIDPHELTSDRPSRTYSGGGVGQVEARLCDAGSAGVGAAGRHLRERTGGEAVLHTGLAAAPQVGIPDADKKQLSTVILPASPTAAAAAAAAAPDSMADTTTHTDAATTIVAETDRQDTSSSSGGNKPSAGGGLFGAIQRTLQEGRSMITGQQQCSHRPEQEQQEEGQQQQGEAAALTAATKDDSTDGGMQESPGLPHSSQVAPGSAQFVKERTPPRGPVAAAALEPPVAAVEESPAAVPGASSSVAAEAPAGSADSPQIAGAPDLSKIVSSHDNSSTGVPSSPPLKPPGGGVGSFLRDTILGPREIQ